LKLLVCPYPILQEAVTDRQAVNSIGIVLKVRYVACGLLDAGDMSMSDTSPDGSGTPSGRKAENSLRESNELRDQQHADVSVDFVDILAKLDKINRITDGW
jgi:hypothetical protein